MPELVPDFLLRDREVALPGSMSQGVVLQSGSEKLLIQIMSSLTSARGDQSSHLLLAMRPYNHPDKDALRVSAGLSEAASKGDNDLPLAAVEWAWVPGLGLLAFRGPLRHPLLPRWSREENLPDHPR